MFAAMIPVQADSSDIASNKFAIRAVPFCKDKEISANKSLRRPLRINLGSVGETILRRVDFPKSAGRTSQYNSFPFKLSSCHELCNIVDR